jgi:hypothetical protein
MGKFRPLEIAGIIFLVVADMLSPLSKGCLVNGIISSFVNPFPSLSVTNNSVSIKRHSLKKKLLSFAHSFFKSCSQNNIRIPED